MGFDHNADNSWLLRHRSKTGYVPIAHLDRILFIISRLRYAQVTQMEIREFILTVCRPFLRDTFSSALSSKR
jgi:hypothetical protein